MHYFISTPAKRHYGSTGAKLRKTVTTMKTTSGGLTDYCGNFICADNQLITIFAGDVRVAPVNVGNSTYWKYEYSMKDHLGNTCVVFAAHSHGQPELLQQSRNIHPKHTVKQSIGFLKSQFMTAT